MTEETAKYKKTIYACFGGYITQAIVNNFIPLLFLTFQSQYQIPLTKITMLVTINFGLQLLVDLAAIAFVDKIGYRAAAILAHICATGGLVLLPILPELLPDPSAFYWLCWSTQSAAVSWRYWSVPL